jgi:flagellar biosynthesis protein FliQ
MEEFYFFWNAFNLIGILTATLGIGLLGGGVITGIVSVITQIEDPALSFFGRLTGCLLGVYLMAPFVLSSFSEFASQIWGDPRTFQ